MADRYRTADGWSAETVRLSLTPDHRDGEWIRVRYYGFFVADVRSIPELARYFPVAALEPDGLGRGHSLYALRRGVGGRRGRLGGSIGCDRSAWPHQDGSSWLHLGPSATMCV